MRGRTCQGSTRVVEEGKAQDTVPTVYFMEEARRARSDF